MITLHAISKKRFLIILLVSIFLSGCSSGAEAPKDEYSAVHMEGTSKPLASKPKALGSATFEIDYQNSVLGELLNDEKDLTLQLTDKSGLTWTLIIPAYSVRAPQTITMTALKDVASNDIPGDMIGGIMLQPDGLQFDTPAKLTVSGDALAGRTILLSGNEDGSEVDFAMPGDDDKSVCVTHFSSYFSDVTEGENINEMKQKMLQQYKDLEAQAREILKNKDIAVPYPPSIPMQCPCTEESKAKEKSLFEFADAFDNPERVLLVKMLAVQKQLQLLGGNADYSVELKLLSRMVKKANLLIDKYGSDIEKIQAISWVVLKVARDDALLGGMEESSTQLLEKVAELYAKAIDPLFKRLVEEHDYHVIRPIFEAARVAQLLSSKTNVSVEVILNRLEKALHFDLEINYTCQMSPVQYTLKSAFPVAFDEENASLTLTGNGTGSLISYKDESDPRITVEAPDFNVQASVFDFIPCNGTAKVFIDRFYPEYETYFGDGQQMLKIDAFWANWFFIFSDYRQYAESSESSNYVFPVTLHNGNVNAVDETIDVVDGAEGKLEFKLVHTPQP